MSCHLMRNFQISCKGNSGSIGGKELSQINKRREGKRSHWPLTSQDVMLKIIRTCTI